MPGDRDDLGPPGKRWAGATADAEHHHQLSARSTDKPIICHAGVAEWLATTRASERLMPLCRCGPDPWLCRCRRPDQPMTEHQLDGWGATAQHILEGGNVPMVPAGALRALHRRGGRDRRLAEQLHAATGGEIR